MPVFSVVIVPPWRKVPKTQEGGNTEVQRTQKGAADGYGLNVATCRQTVDTQRKLGQNRTPLRICEDYGSARRIDLRLRGLL